MSSVCFPGIGNLKKLSSLGYLYLLHVNYFPVLWAFWPAPSAGFLHDFLRKFPSESCGRPVFVSCWEVQHTQPKTAHANKIMRLYVWGSGSIISVVRSLMSCAIKWLCCHLVLGMNTASGQRGAELANWFLLCSQIWVALLPGCCFSTSVSAQSFIPLREGKCAYKGCWLGKGRSSPHLP